MMRSILAVFVGSAAVAWAQAPATPEAVFKEFQAALKAQDGAKAWNCYSRQVRDDTDAMVRRMIAAAVRDDGVKNHAELLGITDAQFRALDGRKYILAVVKTDPGGRLAELAQAELADAKVDGDKAGGTVLLPDGTARRLGFVREGGSWKLGAFSAVELRPGERLEPAEDGGGRIDSGKAKRPDLKRDAPMELPETATDVKMPKSYWEKDDTYYKTAKVGQYVVYEVQNNMKMRREIIERGDRVLVERSTMVMPGMTMKSKMTYRFTEPDPDVKDGVKTPEVKKGDEKLKVGDKEIDCEWLEMEFSGKKTKSWMSKQVPLGGLVKSMYDGKVTMNLVEFGQTAPAGIVKPLPGPGARVEEPAKPAGRVPGMVSLEGLDEVVGVQYARVVVEKPDPAKGTALQVTVPVRGLAGKDVRVQYRFVFLDSGGRPVRLESGWKYETLPPRVERLLTAQAPDAKAADWRLEIRAAP